MDDSEKNSSIISCIRSALNDLQRLEDASDAHKRSLKILMVRLRNLNTFVLCARNEPGYYDELNSLVVRIEDAVRRNGERINSYCLHAGKSLSSTSTVGFEDEIPADVVDETDHFRKEIESFVGEITRCYAALSDFWRKPSSPTPDQVLEIIDSVLENVADILWDAPGDGLAEATEALQEKLAFLKIFIRFSTAPGVESPPQLLELLAHVEGVAVRAAHLCYLCQFHKVDGEEMGEGIMHSKGHKILQLLQQIKPVDPEVGETYTQALKISKLSTFIDGNPYFMKTTTKDFINSLICNLWEMLQMDTCVWKDQLQGLYEGLRSLRMVLKEQQYKFDAKMMDTARTVACDAGIIIFSCYRKDVDICLGLPDLLERIKVIRTETEEDVNELDFVDHLLKSLTELASCSPNLDACIRIQTMIDELVFLRSFLGEIVELRNEQEELQALLNRLLEVACGLKLLIDPLVVVNFPDSFLMASDSIEQDIRRVKTDVLKIFHGKRGGDDVMKVTMTSGDAPSQSSAPTSNDDVGLVHGRTLIINRLIGGLKKLQIIVIAGMPGIGKTTLAQKVYSDDSVTRPFNPRAWCSVSQTFDKNRVLLELLKQICPKRDFDATKQDLADELRKSLKTKKYLIFLDDVWSTEVWTSLKFSLRDDSKGSRIILTSRNSAVIPEDMLAGKPLTLRPLTDGESWELLEKKVFPGSSCPPALSKLCSQIAESCKGVPLTIIIVAGILTSMEKGDWSKVLQSLRLGNISSEQQCENSLQLSYEYLPPHLKQCFLYFGVFPEDQEVPVSRLIWQWIAEGFVQKPESEDLEIVATGYVQALIARSLVMVAKRGSKGGVKACHIHDLLHAFCIKQAEKESFFQLLRRYDELLAFNEPRNLERLCIHSEPKQFKDSRLYCPRACTLLFFDRMEWFRRSLDISFVIYIFKLLKVLDIVQINLGSVFPEEMKLLVHLRYLAVRGEMKDIPSSFGELSNLETFIVDSMTTMVSLPETFWDLKRLRHLYIRNAYDVTGFVLPVKNLDTSPDLLELESFSGAIISWDHMEKQMRKFPNIRKLKCKLLGFGLGTKIAVPESWSRLESLDISPLNAEPPSSVNNHVDFDFKSAKNLTKLTLSGFGFPWSKISKIGELSRLEVLKVLGRAFSGRAWNVEERQFPNLHYLKLASLNVVWWTASEKYERFPCLRKLVLESCKRLEEIPSSCLVDTEALEVIEVSNCSKRVTSSVREIKEEKEEWGNPLSISF